MFLPFGPYPTAPIQNEVHASAPTLFNVSMDIPEGLTQRPLRFDEAGAVTAVMMAQELEDVGEVVVEEADIVGEWQRPSFDVGASTVGVFDGDTLVAYAEVSEADRGDAAVHPSYRGRGIGTALARWMQERARANGASVIGMPVAQRFAGRAAADRARLPGAVALVGAQAPRGKGDRGPAAPGRLHHPAWPRPRTTAARRGR